jgi:hypothetical protein
LSLELILLVAIEDEVKISTFDLFDVFSEIRDSFISLFGKQNDNMAEVDDLGANICVVPLKDKSLVFFVFHL